MALRFAFDGGNSQDPKGKEGVANFITAMMDEGAGDIKSAEFQERMEEIAMRMSWDDSKDSLYGNFETLTQNRDKAVELLKLAVTKPRFDPDAVERIRQQLAANLAYAEKDPDKVAAKAWFALAFDGHPYGRARQRQHGEPDLDQVRGPDGVPQTHVCQGQSQGRGRRRHQRGRTRQAP